MTTMPKKLTYEYLGITEPEEGIIQFEILPEHIKLLRNQKVFWDGEGFMVDPKRPYGSKDIEDDLMRILETNDPLGEHILRLHVQTALVLQIVLKTGKFKATTYRAKKFSMDWKEYNPKLKGKKNNAEREGREGGEADTPEE